MTTKLVNGKRVECTAADLTAIAEKEVKHAAGAPTRALAAIDDIRREEYGSITDQLDEIFHDINSWRTRIAGVKARNPKE